MGKKRLEPPKHSYAYIRQSRKARRRRNASGDIPTTFYLTAALNRHFNPLNSIQAAVSPWDRLKLLNYLPAHMIIPPGTNVSVPPPPLPIFPPNLPMMRFPLRQLLLKPPPTHLIPNPRFFNPCFTMLDKTSVDGQENNWAENPPRPKFNVPPPPLPFLPIAFRPPINQTFVENSNIPSAAPHEFRIFAEHTIKAALGISQGSQLQVRNY